MLRALLIAGVGGAAGFGVFFPTEDAAMTMVSAGSCYNARGDHGVDCDVAEADCTGTPYPPGYVSARNDCCHCKASCESVSDECDYYDAAPTSAGSCYNARGDHGVDCNVAEADCAGTPYAPGYVSARNGCCHCKASCESTDDSCDYNDDDGGAASGAGDAHDNHGGSHDAVSAGSCYNARGDHGVDCDVAEADCEGSPYPPGYVSASSGCCHCKASCESVDDMCDYYDVATDDRSKSSCYDTVTHAITCEFAGETSMADCAPLTDAEGGTFMWTEESGSCMRRMEMGGCDMADGTTMCAYQGDTAYGECDGTWTDEHDGCIYRKANLYAGCYAGAPTHSVTCASAGAMESACMSPQMWLPTTEYCGGPAEGVVWPDCVEAYGCYNRQSHSCECYADTMIDGVPIHEETCNDDTDNDNPYSGDGTPAPSWTISCGCSCP